MLGFLALGEAVQAAGLIAQGLFMLSSFIQETNVETCSPLCHCVGYIAFSDRTGHANKTKNVWRGKDSLDLLYHLFRSFWN